MRYLVSMSNDRKLLLTAQQLELFVSAIDGVEMLVDKHVGGGHGTHGYQNSYVHAIETRRTVDWLTVNPVADDFVDAIKLAAKLEKADE